MSTVMIPHLRSELLNTTALTSTQHKGGMAAVVGIAASIAIPFAAPAIASSLAASLSITMAAGSFAAAASSALVGAAMGAGLAKLTGGSVAMGALGGLAAGGIS